MPDTDPFLLCADFTVSAEGGSTADPADPGNWTGGMVGMGECRGTKYGISAASYPTLDIKTLTRDQALVIYRRDFWERNACEELPLPVAAVMFDTEVNSGPGRPVKWLQSVVGVPQDGDIGPITLRAVTEMGAPAVVHELLLKRLLADMQFAGARSFLKGWESRVVALSLFVGGLLRAV